MKRTVIIAAMIAASTSLFAQTESVAMLFSEYSRNPISAAMGGTVLASEDCRGFYANPALMTLSQTKGDVSLGWTGWQPSGSNCLNLSGAMNFKRISVSVGAAYDIDTPYTISSSFDAVGETFRPCDFIVGAGVGLRFTDWMAMGVNLRYMGQTLTQDNFLGTASADIFLTGKVSDFTVTLAANNLGGKVSTEKNATTRFSPASNCGLGLGWSKEFNDVHKVSVLAEADYYFCKDLSVGAGADYSWNGYVSVRAGYHYGKLIPSYASVGLGGSFAGVHIDVAYLIGGKNSAIGNTAVVALGYRF